MQPRLILVTISRVTSATRTTATSTWEARQGVPTRASGDRATNDLGPGTRLAPVFRSLPRFLRQEAQAEAKSREHSRLGVLQRALNVVYLRVLAVVTED